jgi:hypothetical protein
VDRQIGRQREKYAFEKKSRRYYNLIMNRRIHFRVATIRGWVCASVLLLVLPAVLPAQITIRPDCCALLYSTGRWLGWAASFLEYTRERGAPSPADAILLQSLSLAGENAAAANRSCLQGLQAWPDWHQKQLWLAGQAVELQKPSDPVKSHAYRRQLAASAIGTTYDLWGRELSRQRLDGDLLQQPTCATWYFKLGFDLAYATQAYRQAAEADTAGNRQAALQQLNQTRLRLSKALSVLQNYGPTCADIGLDGLKKLIQYIASRPPSFSSYQQELQIVSDASDRIGQLLLANCVPNQEQRQQPPSQPGAKDPDELAGDWTFHIFAWFKYIGPEWGSRFLEQAREQQRTAMVVRFVRSGNGIDYIGTIIRQPGASAQVPIGIDAFSGRNYLFRQGLELLRLKKIGKNIYRGDNLVVGIPGPNEGFENYRHSCDIIVYGNTAKYLYPADTPQRHQFNDKAGDLMLLYPAGN